jgi:hypothetical protein
VSVALLVMTDGRDGYLGPAVASAAEHLHGSIVEWWMHDDTGDPDQRAALAARYPHFEQVGAGSRRGFDGAIGRAWQVLADRSTADWVFHLEQDFLLRRPVDLDAMAAVLAAHPYLTQMALRRQPWSRPERVSGGVVEMHPEAYTDRADDQGRCWLEHRLFWTTNPSLYPAGLCRRGWPVGPQSEGRFALEVFTDLGARAGYWGARTDEPWVEHIGHERVGHGY